MKKIYIQADMGASGDMIISALLDICKNKDKIVEKLNEINIEGLKFHHKREKSKGISGIRSYVEFDGLEENCFGYKKESETYDSASKKLQNHKSSNLLNENHHNEHNAMHLSEIKTLIDTINVDDRIKSQAKEIYDIIAKAESEVHMEDVKHIHFHELGEKDAVFDIVAICLLLDYLKITEVYSSSINVGSGSVNTAHGTLIVPAPATERILRGMSYYSDGTKGELCTPTGASILKYFTKEFVPLPKSKWLKAGYGLGKKEFGRANVLRIFIADI